MVFMCLVSEATQISPIWGSKCGGGCPCYSLRGGRGGGRNGGQTVRRALSKAIIPNLKCIRLREYEFSGTLLHLDGKRDQARSRCKGSLRLASRACSFLSNIDFGQSCSCP